MHFINKYEELVLHTLAKTQWAVLGRRRNHQKLINRKTMLWLKVWIYSWESFEFASLFSK